MNLLIANALSIPPGPAHEAAPSKPQSSRLDIFLGDVDESGQIRKVKSVGSAYRHANGKTYSLFLRTFPQDAFYLFPETRDLSRGEFRIMTRSNSKKLNHRPFWNHVGDGQCLRGENGGIVRLTWDLLNCPNIFLRLRAESDPRYPASPTPEVSVPSEP